MLIKCPHCNATLNEKEDICPFCKANIKEEMGKIRQIQDRPKYSTAFFIKEALMSAFKPEPIEVLPSNVAYQRRPPQSLTKYLIIAAIMLGLGASLLFGELWLSYLGVTLNCFTIPIVLLAWFFQNDKYDPEPLSLIAYLFGWGAIAGLLSYYLNPLLYPYLGYGAGAFIEEPLKLFGLYLFAKGKLFGTEVNSHLDGIIYGASVGAGFASLENMLYLLSGNVTSVPIALLTRMTTVFCHIAWTAIAARTLGLALVLRGKMQITDLIPGLLIVIPLHFFWNTFIDIMRGWFILPITLLIIFREVNMAVEDEERWGFRLVGPSEKRVRRRKTSSQTRRGT